MRSKDESIEALQAVSSPTRVSILELLEKGPLRYNDLMKKLGLDQRTDAGKFSFHIKKLIKSGLIEVDAEEKKYKLTDRGEFILRKVYEIRSRSSSTEEMPLVRTSKLKFEAFNPRKIVESLVREAGMDEEEADKIALEVSEKIRRLKPKYLTAPLIRELVISTLMEEGEEKIRHKITRLGLPVYDVREYILKNVGGDVPIYEAGKEVLREYALLEALPRKIGDMHMSGLIKIKSLENWPIRPLEISYVFDEIYELGPVIPNSSVKIKKLNEHLNEYIINEFIFLLSKEVEKFQTIVVRNSSSIGVSDLVRSIIFPLQNGSGINIVLNYSEIDKETLLRFFDEFSLLSKMMLVNNLRISIFNVNSREELNFTLNQAIKLSSLGYQIEVSKEASIPLYENILLPNDKNSTISGTTVLGEVEVDVKAVWDASKGKESLFFDKLRSAISCAAEALKIKSDLINNRIKDGFLPILSSPTKLRGTFLNKDLMLGSVLFRGLREVATEASGENRGEKGFIGTLEKITNSIKASISRNCDDHFKLIPIPLVNEWIESNNEGSIVGFNFVSSSLDIETLKEDLNLQNKLIGTTYIGINTDNVESKLLNEISSLDVLKNIILFSKRTICGKCGEIIPLNVSICPYCGSSQHKI